MIYRHSFRVRASLEQVAEFHRRPASLSALTPPPVFVRLHRVPDPLENGAEMAFTLWMGPLPIPWLAQIEALSDEGFTDRQVRGPFAEWVHRHRFSAVNAGETQIDDEITLTLRRHPLWGPVGLGMQITLPLLFAYRAWKTNRLLSRF